MAADLSRAATAFAGIVAIGFLIATHAWAYSRGAHSIQSEWDKAKLKAALQVAEHRSSIDQNNVKEIIRYVDRIQTVEKRVPVVRDRIIRVCEQAAGSAGVPGSGGAAETSASDAAARPIDQLGDELVSARLNQEQCAALIAVVQPQARRD